MLPILVSGKNIDLVACDASHADVRFAWFYSPDYAAYFRDNLGILFQPDDFLNLDQKLRALGETTLMIVDKTGQQTPVGLMNYSLRRPSARVYRFGILLDRQKQGRGLCIEACILMCEWLFQKQNASKITCDVWSLDQHLNDIIRRGGFTHEATFKNEVFLQNTFSDENRYVMFRDTYFTLLKNYQKTGEWNR